jgi:hypothetical protein
MLRRCLMAGLLASVILAPARASDAIPDFSGIWGHLSLPPFEPPLAGPGPVTNRSHLNSLSDVSGVAPFNEPVGSRSRLVSNTTELVGDYTNPILKPEAAES